MPEDDRANTAKSGKNMEAPPKNGPSEGAKHRTFRAQTSELLHRNIGGFAQRSPMFCLFQWKNAEKSLHKGVHFWRTDGFAMPGTEAPGTLRKGKILKFSRQRNVGNAAFVLVWMSFLRSQKAILS